MPRPSFASISQGNFFPFSSCTVTLVYFKWALQFRHFLLEVFQVCQLVIKNICCHSKWWCHKLNKGCAPLWVVLGGMGVNGLSEGKIQFSSLVVITKPIPHLSGLGRFLICLSFWVMHTHLPHQERDLRRLKTTKMCTVYQCKATPFGWPISLPSTY